MMDLPRLIVVVILSRALLTTCTKLELSSVIVPGGYII